METRTFYIKTLKFKLYTFLIFVSLFSCKTDYKKVSERATDLKYAKGFSITTEDDLIKVVVNSPYQNASTIATYTFAKSKKENTLTIPLNRIVVTSTTHIPMVELLEKEQTIIGFPNTRYVSSNRTRMRIDSGLIKEIGSKGNLNTEVLLDLNPQAIISYAVSSPEKALDVLKRANIPVIYNGDWLEETPLGRAEWIKFFGILYNEQQKADSIFNSIESSYKEAMKLAKTSTHRPKILSGAIMSGDIWNLPAGESYVAQFLKDANSSYLWQNSKGKGSLELSFESVMEKAKDADIWIAPGYFSTKEQMLASHKLYSEFKAFKNGQLYTPTTKKGPTGGVLYYELATVRPDLVLKDIIKITHPELLPNYELTFFEKMK